MGHYQRRVAILREVAESLGLEVWNLSDSMLVRRLGRGKRMAALLQAAKDADAQPPCRILTLRNPRPTP